MKKIYFSPLVAIGQEVLGKPSVRDQCDDCLACELAVLTIQYRDGEVGVDGFLKKAHELQGGLQLGGATDG